MSRSSALPEEQAAERVPEMTDPPAEIPELPSERWIDRLVSLLEPSTVSRDRGSTASSTYPLTARCWSATTPSTGSWTCRS